MRRLAIAAAVIAAVVDVLYLGAVRSQSGRGAGQFLTVPFVAGFIALLAIAAALSVRASAEPIRPALLALSATGLLATGYVALFSIGVPLLIAGLLALVAGVLSLTRSPRRAGVQALAGVLVAAVVFVGGFSLTERAITCPPTGFESGGGRGFLLGGAYHYTCVNGRLTVEDGFFGSSGAEIDPSGRVIAVSGC